MPDHEEHPVNGPLGRLVDAWCERRDLHPPARVLPAYIWNFGLTDGWGELMVALHTLRADRWLPEDEQQILERVIVEVERIADYSLAAGRRWSAWSRSGWSDLYSFIPGRSQ